MVQRKLDWSMLPSPEGRFRSRPMYDQDSDTVTLFIAPDESYRERIDRHLTVYRSIETKKVVGCQVKEVRKILATVRALNIGIKTEHVSLGLLLWGVPWTKDGSSQDEPAVFHFRHYQEVVTPLIEEAGRTSIPVPQPA